MKKLLSAILALTMLLSLTACGAPAAAEPDPEPASEPTSDAAEAAPEPEPSTLEGIVKEVSPDKLIITLADGSNVALTTTGIAGLEVEAGDTVKAEYTGAVGAMTASRVEVTAKAEKEIVTVSGVVTGLDDEFVYLTLEDGTDAALRTVSMEEGEVEEGDTLTIHYTDGGGTILSIDVTKAEKEPEKETAAAAATAPAAGSQSGSSNVGNAAGSSGAGASQVTQKADITRPAVVIEVDREGAVFQFLDGSMETNSVGKPESYAIGLDGRKFQVGDEVTFGWTVNGTGYFSRELSYIKLTKAGATTSYDDDDDYYYDDDEDDEEDYTPSSKSSSGGSSQAVEPPAGAGDVNEAIRLINIERENAGLPALDTDPELMKIVQVRADEQLELFSHTRPDGSNWPTVLEEFGYTYSTAVENLGSGTSRATAAAQVDGWMNSPGHKANILNTKITKIGVGYCYDGYKHYWAMIGAK